MRVAVSTIVLLMLTGAALAQSNLPPPVQADLLQRQIITEIRNGERTKALDSLTRYRDLGLKVPLPLLYAEAVLAEEDFPERSLAALDEYLKSAPSTDSNYRAALALYPNVQPAAELARQVRLTNEQQRARLDEANRVAASNNYLLARAREYITAGKPAAALGALTQLWEPTASVELEAEELREQARDAINKIAPEIYSSIAGELRTITIPSGTVRLTNGSSVRNKVGTFRMTASPLKTEFKKFCEQLVDPTLFAGPFQETWKVSWYRWRNAGMPAAPPDATHCDGSLRPIAPIAQKFVDWLNEQSGRSFRMLTVEEWALAFAAGTEPGLPEEGTACMIAVDPAACKPRDRRRRTVDAYRSRGAGRSIEWPSEDRKTSRESVLTEKGGFSMRQWIAAGYSTQEQIDLHQYIDHFYLVEL